MVTSAPLPLHTIKTPLSASDVKTAQLAHLKDLQGNILKFHGRRHAAHLFLKFLPGKKSAALAWIKGPLHDRVTSAHAQLEAAAQFKATGEDGGAFHAFMLSAAGYTYLGKPLAGFADPRFSAGSKASIASLHDPQVAAWETGFQDTIHAMVLIADTQPARLQFMAQALRTEVESFAVVLVTQMGDQQFNERGNGVEHFGYVDGRSQPLMLLSDLGDEPGGTSLWNPMAGPAQVLVADPFGSAGASGSYFVFRKLEEKVRAFKIQEQVLATALGLSGDARELAGALVIGRFEDGTPVTLSSTPMIEDSAQPNGDSVPNNFDYRDDLAGVKCPFHAHIRKSNPRGSGPGGLADEMTRHMARRGITYGARAPDTFDNIASMPEGEVGLLFMSYQRSIVDQFEFIQQSWVNNPGFPSAGAGVDPVIGQSGSPPPAPQDWPKNWGDPAKPVVAFNFRDFVVMKGGEYFFAPSLSGLSSL